MHTAETWWMYYTIMYAYYLYIITLPSYIGITGNETEDGLTKKGIKLSQNTHFITKIIAKKIVKKYCEEEIWSIIPKTPKIKLG